MEIDVGVYEIYKTGVYVDSKSVNWKFDIYLYDELGIEKCFVLIQNFTTGETYQRNLSEKILESDQRYTEAIIRIIKEVQ